MREFLNDFRKFIMRGNLLQLAVAFILGLYFKEVVDAFTKGIVLAFIAAIFGKPNFDAIGFDVGHSRILVGTFLTAIINLLFLIIKAYEAMMARLKSSPEEAEPLTASEELLTEIRDLLRAQAR